jgi:putative amino-acid transport system permease protein
VGKGDGMRISLEGTLKVLDAMAKALPVTMALAVSVLAISLLIAVAMALCEYFEVKGTLRFIKVYTSFFRGTPLVAQLFFFYFGLPNIFPALINMTGFSSAIITMSLNNSAYIKEAIRGALLSVDKGQLEAGRSVGYTEKQVITLIVFPQAARVAIPALANSFIDIIKGSSLAFTVGVIEITAAAQLYSASTLRFFEGYCGLIAMYWFLIVILENILKIAEKRMNRSFE